MVTVEVGDPAQRARNALAACHLVALRRLRIDQDNDRLYIYGRVATFYQKQQAQEIVRSAAQGLVVVNEIEVT